MPTALSSSDEDARPSKRIRLSSPTLLLTSPWQVSQASQHVPEEEEEEEEEPPMSQTARTMLEALYNDDDLDNDVPSQPASPVDSSATEHDQPTPPRRVPSYQFTTTVARPIAGQNNNTLPRTDARARHLSDSSSSEGDNSDDEDFGMPKVSTTTTTTTKSRRGATARRTDDKENTTTKRPPRARAPPQSKPTPSLSKSLPKRTGGTTRRNKVVDDDDLSSDHSDLPLSQPPSQSTSQLSRPTPTLKAMVRKYDFDYARLDQMMAGYGGIEGLQQMEKRSKSERRTLEYVVSPDSHSC